MRTTPLALGLVATAALAVVDSLSYDEAVKNIQANLKEEYPSSAEGLCDSYTCCNVTSAESCDLKSMPKDETTLVLPGGETRCIFSYSTPYAFQVVPGNSDQLLFYFQGGGACWDEASTKAQLCTTDCVPNNPVGVFDRAEELNAYKDYTIVHVMYCSGDIFGGDSVRPYNDEAGEPIEQKGLVNTQAALDWVLQQQKNGGLASELSSLVISGCSAGSLGAQIWYDQLVHQLQYRTVAVMPDSYAGVFPPGAIGPLFYDYNFCSSGFLSEALYVKCMARQLTNMDVVTEYLAKSPTVPVAYLQSKTDTVQMSFYVSLGLTTPNTTAAITPGKFYEDVNDIFELYNKFPNFMTYLVDGQQHCFTPISKYFTADPLSATDNGESTSGPMMYSWTGSMPLQNGEHISTVCEGEVIEGDGGAPYTYCDAELIPKEFLQT